jgi:hypothetical protein
MQRRGPRQAVALSAGALVSLQLVGNVGALLTGGVMVILLGLAAVVLVLRPRPRGWILAGGILAGVCLFVLPWSLFITVQSRAAGADAAVWSWAVAVVAGLGLAAAAWVLADLPRSRLALDPRLARSLGGVVTLLGVVAAAGVAAAAAVSDGNLAVAAGLGVGSWVLLRTLRPADPRRHLADVTSATGLLACLVWWVFVGTLQGATQGLGMLALVVVVFLAMITRTARASDAVPPVVGE